MLNKWMDLGFVPEVTEHIGGLLVPSLVGPAFLCHIFQQKIICEGSSVLLQVRRKQRLSKVK